MTLKKRVLWLLNHTALRVFEVPMLLEMGYEVFTPKIYQHEFGDLSASVTYEYDKSLSIPEEDLELLNTVDFYQDHISEEVVNIMNTYFDIAIFGAFAVQVKMLVRTFKGALIFQAFGLSADESYTRLFTQVNGLSFLDEIKNLGNRFWFGASYENLAEVECDYFKRRFVYLPIGLKKDEVNRIWEGKDERILFVGPKIMTNPYYRNVYKNFKKNFGDIPHVIGGAQMIPVTDDPAVLGFVPAEQYNYNMTHLAAMYYHSREPRHLHYHPLEAVANGMPLVFMSGGMLDELGGKSLPGRCKTIAQARKMLKRLSKGDKQLAEKIIQSQGVLLEKFRKDYCKEHWQQFFAELFQQENNGKATKRSETFQSDIAVVMPNCYTGGVLDFSIRLAQAIQQGARESGDNVKVVLFHPDDEKYKNKDYFKRARESNLAVRTFHWEQKTKKWFDALAVLGGYPRKHLPNKAMILADDVDNLQNFQYVIFTADSMKLPFFSEKRYAVVVHDAIQRYVPEMLMEKEELQRQTANRTADRLLVTTPGMVQTAVQWTGVEKTRVVMIPQMFELLTQSASDKTVNGEKMYFHWGTNATRHKNHLIALNALREYYANGGTMKCHITGVQTDLLNPDDKKAKKASLEKELTTIQKKVVRKIKRRIGKDESEEKNSWNQHQQYLEDVRIEIDSDPVLKTNLVFHGEMERNEYLNLLKNAAFTFHPGYADNGNGVCVEAAQLGIPTLSSDYPPMRYMNERMDMHVTFCDAHDPSDMAQKLQFMEAHAGEIAKEMPSAKYFEQFTWQGQAQEIYQTIRSIIRGY